MGFWRKLFSGGSVTAAPPHGSSSGRSGSSGRPKKTAAPAHGPVSPPLARPATKPFAIGFNTRIFIGGHRGGEMAVAAVKAFLRENPGRILEDEIEIRALTDADETHIGIVYVAEDAQNPMAFGQKFPRSWKST